MVTIINKTYNKVKPPYKGHPPYKTKTSLEQKITTSPNNLCTVYFSLPIIKNS